MQPVQNPKSAIVPVTNTAIVNPGPTQQNNPTWLKVREVAWYLLTFGGGAVAPLATWQICTEERVVGMSVGLFEFFICLGVMWPYLFSGVYAATRPWITLQDLSNNTWTGRAVEEVKNFSKAMMLWTVGTVATLTIIKLTADLDKHRKEDIQAEEIAITALGITMLSVAFSALYMSCARRR
jgi:hypothetical protein